MSSPDQNLDHLKIPLDDIVEATNQFSNENFIRQGGFGKIYKGTLLRSGEMIHIVARRLDTKHGQGSKEFRTEILMLSRLEHENLVSLVGFCDEKNEKIVVNKYEAKGSLDNYLSDPTLTWGKRLHICVGIARALSYLYYDNKRDFSVIHRNIKSSKILLHYFWVPKLSGFELSMTTLSSGRHRLSITDACGSIGYVDPTYVKTGTVTHKSDMYSFGVVLFEVLLGKKAITDNKDTKLAQLAKSHYEEGQLDDLINPDQRKQMNGESLKIFSETAYACFNEDRAGRPDIHQVVMKLEKAVDLQREHTNRALYLQRVQADPMLEKRALERKSSDHREEQNLEHMEFRYSEIRGATYNFSSINCIQVSENYSLHKALLNICDSEYSVEMMGDNKSELHAELSTLAIQRFSFVDKKKIEALSLTEILTLIKYKHPNIVPFLGYSGYNSADSFLVFVYGYPSNGCLADHLESTRNITNYTWLKRIKMCIDIAEGLNYIHTSLQYKKDNLHRNISSRNILLKENWEAMIGVFSRFKQPEPILDYLAGSYMPTKSRLTDRKEIDIFHFGIVLFEILCWRFADNPIYRRNNDEGLVSFVRRCFKDGTPNEILDLNLKGEEEKDIFSKRIDHNSLDTFLNIAYRCLGGNHSQPRPTAELVLNELKRALYLQIGDLNKVSRCLYLGFLLLYLLRKELVVLILFSWNRKLLLRIGR